MTPPMTIDDFITKYDGQYVDIDAMYGNQCKDLFSAYNTEVVGCPFYIYGNANQLWDNAPPEYYTKESTPQRGDVVIWGLGIGTYGHVAIYLEGNTTSFTSFDQNFPIGSPCHTQNHTYTNITGYLRPKGATTMTRGELEQAETKMSAQDQHQHAIKWALTSIMLKDPKESEVITWAGNFGDITLARKEMLKASCKANYPCDCTAKEAEAYEKGLDDKVCEPCDCSDIQKQLTATDEALDLANKTIKDLEAEQEGYKLQLDVSTKLLNEEIAKNNVCNNKLKDCQEAGANPPEPVCPGIDYSFKGWATYTKEILKKWLK